MEAISYEKEIGSAALMAASLMFALHRQNQQSVWSSEPVSKAVPSEQIPVTLVETIDGDTIKVMLNGKVETVRYLLIDTTLKETRNVCPAICSRGCGAK